MTIVKCIELHGPEAAIRLVADVLGLLPLTEETEKGKKSDCKGNAKQKSKPKSVPTSDRIKIPNRIINDCKKAVKEKEKKNMKNKKTPAKKNACPKCKPAKDAKPAKKKTAVKKSAPAPLFTADEQKKILALRKKGLTIKAIGKAIKRRDKSVSAFLKTAKKAK